MVFKSSLGVTSDQGKVNNTLKLLSLIQSLWIPTNILKTYQLIKHFLRMTTKYDLNTVNVIVLIWNQ